MYYVPLFISGLWRLSSITGKTVFISLLGEKMSWCYYYNIFAWKECVAAMRHRARYNPRMKALVTGWRGTCSSRRHTGCSCAPAAQPCATGSVPKPRSPGSGGSSLAPRARSDTEDHRLQTPPAASSARGSPDESIH